MSNITTSDRKLTAGQKKDELDVIDKTDKALTVLWVHGKTIYSIILCLLILTTILSGYFLLTAKSRGHDIGTVTGTTVGLATGSAAGWQHGLDEGKAEGLSAKDVTITISEQFKRDANLEVLKARVIGIDEQKTGDQYDSITLFEGTLLFKVDLSKLSVVQEQNGTLKIILPDIEDEFNPEFENSKELLEAQSFFNNGSTGRGVIATQNSFNEISKNIESKIGNYTKLKELAQQAAKERVAKTAEAVGINPHQINVCFVGDKENG